MSLPAIFTSVFIVAGSTSFMFGLYILRIKKKAAENKAFFAVTIALLIWSFGLGMALSAESESTSLLYRRVAAVGWGSFFSILLHFSLLLTRKPTAHHKTWLYVLIYLPAALNILIFSIPTTLNPLPFIMVKTNEGWINVAQNNGWDIYYMICYISLMAASLAIIWRWGAKSLDRKVKNQAKFIFIIFIIALALSTATDVLANTFLKVKIPQVAPLVILLPIGAIYLSMRWYGLLNHTADGNAEILNDKARKRLYLYLTVSLVFISVMNFVTQYVLNSYRQLVPTLALCLSFLLIALAICIVNRTSLGVRTKDSIDVLSLSIIIPLITLGFVKYGSLTAWASPFVLIIIAMVFSKGTVLRIVSFLAIITQVVVWIITPQVVVRIDSVAYATRICMLIVGIGLALYINKVYGARLKENTIHSKMQALVSEISTDFITANQANFDEKINSLLLKSGRFFESDKSYACFFDNKTGDMHRTHSWLADEALKQDDQRKTFSAGQHPWWVGQVLNKEVVHISDTSLLPACADRVLMMSTQCRAILAIPAMSNQTVLGFLCFISTGTPKTWQDEQINFMKVLANTLAVTKTKLEAEKEISYMAYYDQLTGLPNRQLFNDRLKQAILNAGMTNKQLGVIFLDLDAFKVVNDTLGHDYGDDLLKVIAQGLQNCVRQSDTVSRFGGDEFLILVNSISDEDEIVRVADNIMKLFHNPVTFRNQEFFITGSAGIAMYPEDGMDSEKLIKNADIAMYSAKETGKNQYAMCSAEMKETLYSNASLTTSLYRALGRNEFILYYQPQVCLQTQEIIGLEALLRWKSPEHGMVSPAQFIPLAEQTGLINPIGEWVLRTACQQNKQWQQMGLPPVRMAVNLSVIQLRNPKLRNIISGALENTGLDPEYLELEITESAATRESEYIIDVLSSLKKLGVTLSIDDFGTEYSSLSRLKLLPIDRIKMDMQFVRGIEGSEKDKAITKVIINLGKSLGLKVIAEGVETDAQLNYLQQKMCDEVQGFYFFKPMPADQVETVLRNMKAHEAGDVGMRVG